MAPKKKRPAVAAEGASDSDRSLYDLLGVSQKSSPAEIQRGYRVRAREVHPDKNLGSETAAEDFRQVHAAYEILSDPERRARYDEFGDAGVGEGSDAAYTHNFVRSRFKPLSTQDIAAFESDYRGSAEERCDFATFVRKQKGDVSKLFEHVICSEPSHLERFEALIEELFCTGEVPVSMRSAVDTSLPKLRRAAAALLRRGRKEKQEAEASSEQIPKGLADLALQIRERQRQRGWAASIVSEIEEKYGKAAPGRLPGNVRKRPAAAAERS